MIYLASPYSVGKRGQYGAANTGTATSNMKTRRFKAACRKAAELMSQGEVVFSPIAHSHSIELYGNPELKTGDFWLNQDLDVLKHCDLLMVYRLDGWEDSRGIATEIAFAEANGIPVEYID